MSTIWCLFNTQRRSNGQQAFSALQHSCLGLGKIIDFTPLPDDLCVLELSMTMTTTLLLKTALSGTETTWIQHGQWILLNVPLVWLTPSDKLTPGSWDICLGLNYCFLFVCLFCFVFLTLAFPYHGPYTYAWELLKVQVSSPDFFLVLDWSLTITCMSAIINQL